jgi:hypothetical protein
MVRLGDIGKVCVDADLKDDDPICQRQPESAIISAL